MKSNIRFRMLRVCACVACVRRVRARVRCRVVLRVSEYDMLHATHDTRHVAYNTRHATCCMQHTTHDMQHVACARVAAAASPRRLSRPNGGSRGGGYFWTAVTTIRGGGDLWSAVTTYPARLHTRGGRWCARRHGFRARKLLLPHRPPRAWKLQDSLCWTDRKLQSFEA